MNILQIISDVVIALLIVIMVLLGIKRGFIKSVFKSTKMLLVILVTFIIGSLVVSICKDAFVSGMFEGKISEKLVARVGESDENLDFEGIKDGLPQIVQNIVPMDEMEEHFSTLSGNNVEKAQNIGAKVEATLINVVSSIIGYATAFILSFIICSIAIFLIEKFFELPVLGFVNHLAGFLWGLASAYLAVSFFVCLVALFFGKEFIEGTIFTRTIYNFGLFTF